MKVLKEVLGVDVAQKELVVTLGRMYDDLTIELYAHKVFKNNLSAHEALLKWVDKLGTRSIKVHFVMEATGVYHQKFAYFLKEKNRDVSIILPNKISNYIRTLEVKTINDKTCSEAIARFGLERKLEFWNCPKPTFKSLQQLTRERYQIVSERAMVKNQMHAELTEVYPNPGSIGRMESRIKFLSQQEKEIKYEISLEIKKDLELKKELENICTIPGVGELTAVTVLAETNGFELIRNKKQLVSYAGLDVREKQSGTSIKGKSTISKKGNKNLRRAMHLPSLSAVKKIPHFTDLYVRLVQKSGIKMKGLVAVQRKLLELMYTIYKTKNVYNKDYEINKREQFLQTATL